MALAAAPSLAQTSAEERLWNEPVEPFRIVGNVYYVGAREVSAYLVKGRDRSVLIDSGFAETAPLVLKNLETLAVRPREVGVLLATHAHYDHVGGLAALREATGAAIWMSEADAELAGRGGLGDPNFGDRFRYRAFRPDRVLRDGDTMTVGGARLTALVTPGHTPGCTSWQIDVTERGRPLRVLVVCSVTAPGYRLVDNAAYPGIADDYAATFRRLAGVRADVLLASHGSVFDLLGKRAALGRNPERNPFVDAAEAARYLERSRKAFERELAEQRAAASTAGKP
jgi:metallo-beta-lactamase class B